MIKIDRAERRRRLAERHHLAPECRAPDVVKAADAMVGIHGTDPGSVYLAALARTRAVTPAAIGHALYEDRTLLKILGMRRTMFVVPRELAAIVTSAATEAIALRERRRTLSLIESAGVVDGDVASWMEEVERETIGALREMGQATASELTRRVPGLRVQIPFGAGRQWAGTVGVSTRMLFLLSAEARIIRGRPRGTWISSLYNWAPIETWLGGPLPRPPKVEAQAELVRRWLTTYGPGRLKDIAWWTGWTMAETRRALAGAGAVEVALDEGTGHALAEDVEATAPPEPWIALLPTLDSTTMGWQERGWFLGEYAQRLFDRRGNGGPTIWADGRVVGGWAQRRSGEVVVRLLEDVGRERTRAIEAEAARIEAWLDTTRVIPRFRTPLEQELSAA